MDMNPMKEEKKDPTFKCPSCGEMLSVESKGESDSEHQKLGKKVNAGNMPMTSLKDKISSSPSQPNLNSY
jgi:transcription initiation factor IIE alpha subunit